MPWLISTRRWVADGILKILAQGFTSSFIRPILISWKIIGFRFMARENIYQVSLIGSAVFYLKIMCLQLKLGTRFDGVHLVFE